MRRRIVVMTPLELLYRPFRDHDDACRVEREQSERDWVHHINDRLGK